MNQGLRISGQSESCTSSFWRKGFCHILQVYKKNLKTNFIDSYILHSPIYPAKNLLTVWQKMEEFVEKNEVGILGISSCYDLDVLKYLFNNTKIKPSIVQNRFYAQTFYDVSIRNFCFENGIL